MPHHLSDFWLLDEAHRKLSTLRHEAHQHGLRRHAHPLRNWRNALALQLVQLAQHLSPGVAVPSRSLEDA